MIEVAPTKEAVAAFVAAQRKAGKHALVAFFKDTTTPGAQDVVVLGPELERDDNVVLAMCYTDKATLEIGASEDGSYGVRFFGSRDPKLTDWFPVDTDTVRLELARSVKKVAWPSFKWHEEGDIPKAFDKVSAGRGTHRRRDRLLATATPPPPPYRCRRRRPRRRHYRHYHHKYTSLPSPVQQLD